MGKNRGAGSHWPSPDLNGLAAVEDVGQGSHTSPGHQPSECSILHVPSGWWSRTLQRCSQYTFLWKNYHQNCKVLKPWVWRDAGWENRKNKALNSGLFGKARSTVHHNAWSQPRHYHRNKVLHCTVNTCTFRDEPRQREDTHSSKACSLAAFPSWRWNPPTEVWFSNQQSLMFANIPLNGRITHRDL